MISLKTKEWIIEDIDTIIFDKDGTFIDLDFLWGKITELRSLEIIKRYGLDSNLLKDLCFDLGFNIEKGKMMPDGITALYSRSKIIEIFVEKIKKYNVFVSKIEIEEIFDYVSEDFYNNLVEYIKPIESAVFFIKKLYSKGVKLGIVTSDSIKSTKLTLKHYDWEYLFNVVVARESLNATKESGELTKLALKELNSKPNKTVMIGDAPMDYFSAKNAEVNMTVLVSTGQIEKTELEKYSSYYVNTLEEIEIL